MKVIPLPGTTDNYKWTVLVLVMIGTLMAALDSSIVNVSLPAIMADFGASVDEIEWVVTGYMMAFATLMPLTTWFRDYVGHKQLYIMSLVLFTVGSLLCGLAWDLPSLVAARVIQALGGGAITPTGMAMISEVFPPRERAKALGYWGVGVIVGPAFGPTLGGFLTKSFGWRSIFLVNLPIGILGALLCVALLRGDKPHTSARRPFDTWGFVFLSMFLVAFLLGISKGEHEGWASSYVMTCFAVGAIGFVGLLLVESIISHGLIDLSLFRFPVFTACIVVTVIRSVALFGGVFLLPLFLQQVKGLDEVESGLILLPGSLVIGFMMPLASKVSDRFGPRLPTLLGLVGVGLFMYMYRSLDVNTSVWDIVFPTLIRGVGIGLLFTPVMATALNVVPKEKSGMASALLNLCQQVGGSVGIAILATVLSHRIKFHFALMAATVNAKSPAYFDALHRLSDGARLMGLSHSDALRAAGSQLMKNFATAASVSGFDDAFLFGACIVVSGFFATFLLPNTNVGHAGPELAAME